MLHALPVFLFLTADGTPTKHIPAPSALEIQEKVMHRLIRFTGYRTIRPAKRQHTRFEAETLAEGLRRRGLITSEIASTNVCDWKGVECEGDIIKKVHMFNTNFCPDYAWLPNTCTEVNMDYIEHRPKEAFQMALLPREITSGSLSGIQLFGSLDLCRLPEKIEYLSVGENNFTGTAHLTKLPASLKFLYLYKNPIACCFFDSHRFSNALNDVKLSKAWGGRKLRMVCFGDPHDWRVTLM